ncbi:MAG: FmdB family zinc ribbon protein [Burkholderiaceae bacterium]
MPIYAYRCEGCGFQKDALQKLSDPPLVDCPQCGQPRLAKQLTAAGFALKGSGWYVTDFRDQGKTSSAAPPAPNPGAAPPAPASGEASSATPPAAPLTPTSPSSTSAA